MSNFSPYVGGQQEVALMAWYKCLYYLTLFPHTWHIISRWLNIGRGDEEAGRGGEGQILGLVRGVRFWHTARRAHAVHPITAVQVEYSLWTRDVEEDIIPTCRYHLYTVTIIKGWFHDKIWYKLFIRVYLIYYHWLVACTGLARNFSALKNQLHASVL